MSRDGAAPRRFGCRATVCLALAPHVLAAPSRTHSTSLPFHCYYEVTTPVVSLHCSIYFNFFLSYPPSKISFSYSVFNSNIEYDGIPISVLFLSGIVLRATLRVGRQVRSDRFSALGTVGPNIAWPSRVLPFPFIIPFQDTLPSPLITPILSRVIFPRIPRVDLNTSGPFNPPFSRVFPVTDPESSRVFTINIIKLHAS